MSVFDKSSDENAPQRRALLIWLCTLLLAIGWLGSSYAQESLQQDIWRQTRMQTLDVVQNAVDERLEALLAREEERPFTHYNHYYVPEGVLSSTAPLAISPLAALPSDPRIIGYFQIDAYGNLRTPYDVDDDNAMQEDKKISDRLRSSLRKEEFNPLFLLVKRDSSVQLHAKQKRGEGKNEKQDQDVNVFNNEVLQQYQQEKTANTAKKVPLYSRKNTSWRSRSSSSKTHQNADKRSNRNRRTKNVIDDNAGNERRQAQAIRADSIFSATLRRARAEVLEVGYTPMVLEDFGNHLAFFRTVTREGATFVQGALLNARYMENTWLPSIIERRSPNHLRPKLRDDVKGCVLFSTASELWNGPKLCFVDEKEGSVVFWLQVFLLSLLVGAGSLMGVQGVRAAKEARRLAGEQKRFLAAVSHELRTPLTTMRMHAELLFAGLVREEKKQKFLQDLVTESQRLSLLVENVLETSRLQAGKRPLSLQRLSLNNVVTRTLEEQNSFLTHRGATIEMVEAELDLMIYGDEQALKQVLLNLLDNAVKYGLQTGDSLVVVRVKKTDSEIELHVEDGGAGVRETEREAIFEPFYRSSQKGEHVVGTGIGLSLSRSLLEGMGGTVVVKESSRGGADFCVVFQMEPLLKGEVAF